MQPSSDEPAVPGGSVPAIVISDHRSEELAVRTDLESLIDIERQLGDVDVAMRRLDDGTYGTCETCAAPIDEAVLAVAPLTRRCAPCGIPRT